MNNIVSDPTDFKTTTLDLLKKYAYASFRDVPPHLVTNKYLSSHRLKALGPVVKDVVKIDGCRPPHKQHLPVASLKDILGVRNHLEQYKFTQEIVKPLEHLEYLGYARHIHLYDINQTRPIRTRTNKPKTYLKDAFAWLKDRISYLCYGRKAKDGKPKPVRNKETLIKNYNEKKLPRLAVGMLEKHFNDQDTLYFWADHRQSTDEIIFLIDIDALKAKMKGSKEGAINFAKYLIDKYFPNAYMELSTHANGVHLFLVMRKKDISNEDVRKALKHLDAWLKYIARSINADIEEVEVKGLPPIVQYDGKKVVGMTYGLLAKLPRELLTRLPDLQATYRCTPGQLLELDVPVEERKIAKSKGGSVSGRLISEEEVANLGWYKQVGIKLLKGKLPVVMNSRHKISWDDVAIMLLILKYNYEHPEPDNSLSSKLIEGLWRALFDAGDVGRGYHASRIKPLRDALSDGGFLDWLSNEYQYGYMNSDGEYVKGVSCKWRITEEVYDLLADERQEASSISTEMQDEDAIPIIRPKWVSTLLKPEWQRQFEWLYNAEKELENVCYAA